jgi:hypothetical protein
MKNRGGDFSTVMQRKKRSGCEFIERGEEWTEHSHREGNGLVHRGELKEPFLFLFFSVEVPEK